MYTLDNAKKNYFKSMKQKLKKGYSKVEVADIEVEIEDEKKVDSQLSS